MVFDDEYQFAGAGSKINQDWVSGNVLVAMPHHVGKRLFKTEVDGERGLLRDLITGCEHLNPRSDTRQFGEVTAQFKPLLHGEHQFQVHILCQRC